jgi:hypothetical protein
MQAVTTRTLTELKAIVSRTLESTIECARALKEIKDRELWKDESDSFQAFCTNNWGVSRTRAYQLIDYAEVVDLLPAEMSTAVDTERVARELHKAPEEARVAILEQVQQAGPVTGPAVAKAVKEMKAPEPPKLYDRTGFEIPPASPAAATWIRSEEIQTLLTALSRIKGVITKGCGNPDPKLNDVMFNELNVSAFMADLQSSFQQLKVCLPFAVCPTCQGRVLSECRTCGGRGMISEFYWKHKVPEKTKEIRERAVTAMVDKRKGAR